MNPHLERLQAYPFSRLAELHRGLQGPERLAHIGLSIGEPKHAPPAFVRNTLIEHLDKLAVYPSTRGIAPLRRAIAQWLCARFQLDALCPQRQVLPVNGTREALFAFAQTVVTPGARVLMPNPYYQIYEGAALLAGARPHFINCCAEGGFKPDFAAVPDSVWRTCDLLYLCSPNNPTGALLDEHTLAWLIERADQFDFIIAADECYSELYFDETQPPPGLLQACQRLGRRDYRRCVVFHSLSKRSNLPGLRSGFVAGDGQILQKFLRYRTYHGGAMATPSQYASAAAWQDEQHVRQNRAAYREKFAAVLDILCSCMDIHPPQAGLYLWPRVGDDEAFARELLLQQNITVLPGSYLAREAGGINPGAGYVRIALVPPLAECVAAAQRLRQFCR